jgi:hypothetical protein
MKILPPAVMVKGIVSSLLVLTLLTLLCFSFSGCASKSPPNVVRVDVPVLVPCVIQDVSKPRFAVDDITPDSDIWDMMTALRAERIQRKAYEFVLESALSSCR